MNAKNELRKVRREIQRQGSEYTFTRKALNEFGEPMDTNMSFVLKGLYHEERGYISKTITEGASIQSKPTPMILCETRNANSIQLKDEVIINNNTYSVTGKNDLQNYNIITNISLELMI